MKKKIKIYRMPISRVFPATHPKKGQKTYFDNKIKIGICWDRRTNNNCPAHAHKPNCYNCEYYVDIEGHSNSIKLHTIRANYELWRKRIDEVNAGNAILVLYEWTGKPYHSKTNELFRFDKDSGIGIQEFKLNSIEDTYSWSLIDNRFFDSHNIIDFATNDGLSLTDFKDWFKNYDLSKQMAIIHFTKFRY